MLRLVHQSVHHQEHFEIQLKQHNYASPLPRLTEMIYHISILFLVCLF